MFISVLYVSYNVMLSSFYSFTGEISTSLKILNRPISLYLRDTSGQSAVIRKSQITD